MKPSLCYTYCTLLLVSLVSSCTLFLIVASEKLKPTTDDQLQQHGAGTREPLDGSNLVQQHTDGAGERLPSNGGVNEAKEAFPHKRVLSSGNGTPPGHVRSKNGPGEEGNGAKPLKRPAPGRAGGRNTLKKDILTAKPHQQQPQEEPPDLKDVIFLETISKNVGVTNSGLQDIPGPPSIITLVDNQHHELNNIESKLEENLEATLKNLSHNNVHTVQTTVPLHGNDHGQLAGEEEAPANGTTAVDQQDLSIGDGQENEQPLLVMIPAKDPTEGPASSSTPSGEPAATQETTAEATLTDATAPTVLPPSKQLEVNLTEENPMPVFSEWAQKQMAEAEKKLGEVVNASAMKKGTKPAGSKAGTGSMKLRAKNYAAPECGAKIIASNPEAQSTGSVLTAPKDEYLLNPCTSKIWFVVELCEPVQAERIELANFELFSSSPKEFSVSVSNRFPTRDWANVGQFTAKDERDVQSFLLHPHLFGKFVRVEILSHYNQEHFCPVSLFRVYGTSEFEAFETDNTPLQPDEDDDDDELVAVLGGAGVGKDPFTDKSKPVAGGEGTLADKRFVINGGVAQRDGQTVEPQQGVDATTGAPKGGKNPNNILKSAGEVVMNMVKKAAEALGKSGNESNDAATPGSHPSPGGKIPLTDVLTGLPSPASPSCVTLAYTIRCVNCTDHFRARLESLMNCKHNLLTSLLGVARIEHAFDSAQHFLCANVLGFNLPRSLQGESEGAGELVTVYPSVCLNMRYSVLNLLPDELVAGLCNTVAFDLKLLAKVEASDAEGREIDGSVVAGVDGPSQNALDLPQGENTKQGEHHQQHQVEQTLDVETTAQNGNEKGEQQEQNAVQEDSEKGSPPRDVAIDPSGSENASKEDVNMFATEPTPPAATPAEPERDEASQNVDGQKEQEQQQQQEDFANNQHWETIDDQSEMAGTGPSGSGAFTTGPAATTVTPGMATGQQKVQPESVFLRLSNRIKALERNMSLSGQYLEELSRRYRKQVEELQHSYAKTLHEIQEQNQRMADSETKLREVNERLRQELVDFQATATDWRNIALAVLTMIVLMLFTLLAMVRSVARSVNRLTAGHPLEGQHQQQQHPVPLPKSVIDRELAQVGSDAKPIRGRMLRRKSIDGMPTSGGSVDLTGSTVSSASGIIIATAEPSTVATSLSPGRLRKKRPSEEALNISGTYVNLLIDDDAREVGVPPQSSVPPLAMERKKSKQKHRKVSAPSMMGVISSSTPLATGQGVAFSSHEPAKRSLSMIEARQMVNGGGQQTPEKDTSSRIDELPYLEDNDEFIIPTASDLSYDEYMPGSNASTAEAGLTPNEMEMRKMNGTANTAATTMTTLSDRNGSSGMSPSGEDSLDGGVQQKAATKSSRRLSSPAFFKSSLLRSSLGSKKHRSAKKGTAANGSGGSSSSGGSSANTSSNSSNSSNTSSALRELGAGDAGMSDSARSNAQDSSWYRWWSSEQSKGVLSSPSPASSQEVAASPEGKQQQRQRIGKAKSASPSDGASSKLLLLGESPVKLSVSFNGDLPANGGSGGVLERKSSRGSIRRLFRKVF
ncbi:SUN domain-containing ossification factor isoform X1 [Anopheles gambiae]|uniref:SUN domain-containing ossification factor isoform X1 n=1 Tax=Anopheles gambiae TaxID=7165 RepID=UPI002AC97115|nr:SUN domain-containing ossification factor isoform X1 [Anopheles gambiae]